MTDIILALSAMFVTAGVLLLVANHFGLSPIPFYIIAGLLVGPFIALQDLVELAQWGIAFLVFVFGIRIDLHDVQAVFRDAEVAAFVQIAVVGVFGLLVGYGFSTVYGFEYPIRNAIYFSAAATFSSTLVGAGALERDILDNLVHGRLASSIHFFDDMVAIGAILILSAAVLTDVQLITSNIGFGVLFLLAGLIFYRHGYPLLIRAAEGFDELILMGSISILIAFIAAAEAVGISIVIGAFAAGIAVRSEGAEAIGVQNGIESIRDFFVAIFFVTVGALVQLPTLEVVLIACALLVLVLLVNPLILTVTFIFEGYDPRTSFLAGLSLNQVSELSLIIAIQAFLLGTIADRLFDAIILTAAVTMILTVVTKRHEETIYTSYISQLFGRWQAQYVDEHSQVEDGISEHVVLVGYGRQGRQLTRLLDDLGKPCVVVENDPVLWDDLRTQCKNYVFGDAMALYTMERANVSGATLVISTVDHGPVSTSLLDLETDADLILRANSSRKAMELLDAGATFVTVPSVLASDQLVENVKRLVEDEHEVVTLQNEHLDALSTLERHGFATRFEGS